MEKGRGIKIKVEKQEFRCLARNFLPDLNFLVWLKNYTTFGKICAEKQGSCIRSIKASKPQVSPSWANNHTSYHLSDTRDVYGGGRRYANEPCAGLGCVSVEEGEERVVMRVPRGKSRPDLFLFLLVS